jgi:hypothetical protein
LRAHLKRGEASPEFLEDMVLDDLDDATRSRLREELSGPSRFALLEEVSYLLLLNAGKEDVRRASSITMRGRFMVQNRERLLKLREDEELLKQLVVYLKKLVDGVEVPGEVEETGKGTQLYLRWYEVPGPDGVPIAAEKPRSGKRTHKPGEVRMVSLWTEIYYVNTDLVAEHRQYWRDTDRADLADAQVDRLPYPAGSEPHHGRYAKSYVARISANGQTLYLQHACGLNEYGASQERNWTCGRILGLTEGVHEAQVKVMTEDGIGVETTMSFVVDAPDPRKERAAESYEKRLSDFRRRQAADKAAGRTTSLVNLPGYLVGYSKALLDTGQGTPEQILSMMEEAFKVSGQVRDVQLAEAEKRKRPADSAHRSYIRRLHDIVEICEWLGGGQAYAVAQAAAQAEVTAFVQNASLLRKEGTETAYNMDRRSVIFSHVLLANLAISSGNDAKAAVKHLEDWMEIRRQLGDEIDEQYEKHKRLSWPQDVQL